MQWRVHHADFPVDYAVDYYQLVHSIVQIVNDEI